MPRLLDPSPTGVRPDNSISRTSVTPTSKNNNVRNDVLDRFLAAFLCFLPQVSVLPAGEEGGAGRTSPLRCGAGHQTSWSSSAR